MTQASVRHRKTELSWMNLAFCAMVLLIHCCSQPVTLLQPESWQFVCIYSIQRLSFVSVYGFFLLSGIKLTLPRERRLSVSTYYRGRLRSIFLPYLLAGIVYYGYFSFLRHSFSPDLGDFLRRLCIGDLSAPFYFIVTLAQFVVLMPLLRYTTEHVSPALLLPLALAITWMSALQSTAFVQLFAPSTVFPYGDRVFTTYLFYYLAGCYIGRQYEAFLTILEENARFITSAALLTAGFDLWLSYRGRVLGLWSPLWPMAQLAYLPCGIAFCFLLARRIRQPLPHWLKAVDRASFLIYLYHALVINMPDALLGRAGVGVKAAYFIRLAVVFGLVPPLCVLWQNGWQRVRQKWSA